MTKQDLRAFRSQCAEVRQIEQQLDKLAKVAPHISQFDKILVEADVEGSTVEQTVEKYLALRERYEDILNAYIDEKLRIERAFECLTPNERAALRYYYFEGMTWEKTAEQIDKSVRYVLTLHKWALIKLKDY
jgi:RNA polymerase sigma factor (sigma-70 family)